MDEGQGGIRDLEWWIDRGNGFVTKITNSQMRPENSLRVSMFILTSHHKNGSSGDNGSGQLLFFLRRSQLCVLRSTTGDGHAETNVLSTL